MNIKKNIGIPISVSLDSTLDSDIQHAKKTNDKKRLLIISGLAVIVAVSISFIAKILVYLINLITNISFYGRISILEASPEGNSLHFDPLVGG